MKYFDLSSWLTLGAAAIAAFLLAFVHDALTNAATRRVRRVLRELASVYSVELHELIESTVHLDRWLCDPTGPLW
jgi:hypothetical protein